MISVKITNQVYRGACCTVGFVSLFSFCLHGFLITFFTTAVTEARIASEEFWDFVPTKVAVSVVHRNIW